MLTLQYEITLSEEDRKNATSMLSEPESEEGRNKALEEIRKWIDSNFEHKGKFGKDQRISLFLKPVRIKFAMKLYFR